jgi:signal transduction histidine kinase
MAERAELVGGHLDVRSRPGRGTTIEARVPGNAPPGERPSISDVDRSGS